MRYSIFTVSLTVVLLASGSALADWNEGDPHKMHYPQLPKVDGGWDVMSSYYVLLADDFECTQTGYINDIHVWVSFQNDVVFEPATVHLAIWSDIPDPDGDGPLYSMPGTELWHNDTISWTTRLYDIGNQGWFDARNPAGTMVEPTVPDHTGVYQMNFLIDDTKAFWQEEGTIYWLEFTIQSPEEVGIGWKESADHFQDDAVWRTTGAPDVWNELIDPITLESMDLAFVITPEPATLCLLAIGGLLFVTRRK